MCQSEQREPFSSSGSGRKAKHRSSGYIQKELTVKFIQQSSTSLLASPQS